MDSLTRAMKACGNPHRLRLLKTILEATKPVRQHALVQTLGIPQFLATRYLQLLVDARLIRRERRGFPVVYFRARAVEPELRRLLNLIKKLPLDLFDITRSDLERVMK